MVYKIPILMVIMVLAIGLIACTSPEDKCDELLAESEKIYAKHSEAHEQWRHMDYRNPRSAMLKEKREELKEQHKEVWADFKQNCREFYPNKSQPIYK